MKRNCVLWQTKQNYYKNWPITIMQFKANIHTWNNRQKFSSTQYMFYIEWRRTCFLVVPVRYSPLHLHFIHASGFYKHIMQEGESIGIV